MKKNERCSNCRFFIRKKAQDKKGECRRNAPHPGPSFQISGKDIGREPRWPEVPKATFCAGPETSGLCVSYAATSLGMLASSVRGACFPASSDKGMSYLQKRALELQCTRSPEEGVMKSET